MAILLAGATGLVGSRVMALLPDAVPVGRRATGRDGEIVAGFAATIAIGEADHWSCSRRELWHKGATSGHIQRIVEMRVDCDQDAIWLKVDPAGPACHTGEVSCFYRKLTQSGLVRD
jgi:hypothetical protein